MCKNIAPSSAPGNAVQKISFVLIAGNNAHLRTILITKTEKKSRFSASHDMYNVLSQACCVPDGHGLLIQSITEGSDDLL